MFEICVIPGGQRCGSTYLAKLLSNFDRVKEPCLGGTEPKWFLNQNNAKLSINDYVDQVFGDLEKNSKKILLDKSTSYFYSETVPSEIFNKLGQIRIILILRNPVMRAVSHFKFSKNNGFENLDFHEAIRKDPESRSYDSVNISMNPYSYIKNGQYDSYLCNWIKFFPNMKVVFLEELSVDSEVLRGICDYLEIQCSPTTMPWNSTKVNNSYTDELKIGADDLAYLHSAFKISNSNLSEVLGRELPFKW